MNTCCCKALKHGESECPVCGTILIKTRKKTVNVEVEKDGQYALLFDQPKQLAINFNQRTK